MLSPVAFPTVQIEQAGLLAPLFGLRAGAGLTVTPVSWPRLPAVVAPVGPARAAAASRAPAAAVAAGGRWLVPDDPRTARRVALTLAAVLLLSAAYYAWRLLDGQVIPPGEGGLLP